MADQATKMETEQARKKSKTEIVPNIVSRLLDELLISEEEKRKIEVLQPTEMKAAIFDLMSTKDSSPAAKIFFAISANDEHEAEKKFTNNEFQNPMQIHTVLRNVFGFLNVEDLKTCRVVCQKWNFEAEPLIRKSAAIKFGYRETEDEDSTALNDPDKFLETFRHFSVSTTNLPFTSFRFSGYEVEWTLPDLKNFIGQQKKNIQELNLCGVRIFLENNWDWEKEFNISDLFVDFFVPKLTIECWDKVEKTSTTAFEFPLNILASTTHIKLDKCRIEIGSERPIAPIAIDIIGLNFLEEGEWLDEYCLNDSIDFTKTKDIRITGCNHHDHYTLPILDISKCLSAEYISLNNIEVSNWKDSKVEVKTLILEDIPFLGPTKMEIKELHFSHSSIDLFALPLSIEKIHLGPWNKDSDAISCTQPISLPNLKYLKVKNSEEFQSFAFFANCPNLRDIEIDDVSYRNKEAFDLLYVPKSVERLKLKEIKKVFGYDRQLRLERLVLEDYSLLTAATVLNDIVTTNILVLQWERYFETSASVLLFLQEFKDLILFIGPFIWDDSINVFETSPFSARVDRKSEYYVFENNQGRAIQLNKFTDMKILGKN